MSTFFSEVSAESAHRFALSEIEDATSKFEKKIGSGGFGIVYYGKLTDGKEIAVKVLTNDSFQGIREFLNEVNVPKLSWCVSIQGFVLYKKDFNLLKSSCHLVVDISLNVSNKHYLI